MMADNGAKMDMPAHQRTYARFIGLFRFGAVASFIVAAIVVLIITH
jgi:hypothetical protein